MKFRTKPKSVLAAPAKKFKKSGRKVSEKLLQSQLGSEANYDGKELGTFELIKAYNWYNAMFEKASQAAPVAKQFALEYLKSIGTKKAIMDVINAVHESKFITFGWSSRIQMRGGKLPATSMAWYQTKFDSLVSEGKSIKAPAVKDDNEVPRLSVQDHMAAQLSEYLAGSEEMLDKAMLVDFNVKKFQFKPADWLAEQEIKGPQAKKIAEFYKPMLKEATAASKKKDAQLTEAFAKPKALKGYVQFLKEFIEAAEARAMMAKASRKPRAKKVKSAAQLTGKVKFKASDDTYKITSVHPSNIVGALELWTFNTKTRKLAVFEAMDAGGLSMKGTTIQNWAKATSKKLRKPEKVLPGVVSGGKVALRKVMESINAKAALPKPRINADTLLLRVVK